RNWPKRRIEEDHRTAMRSSICCATLLAATFLTGAARADEDNPGPTFEARINRELGVASGLTSEALVERALATSFDVAARKDELMAAAADADRALLGYLPDLTVAASYTRLSDVGVPMLGNLVVAPGAPVGPLAPGATLVNFPITLESILN